MTSKSFPYVLVTAFSTNPYAGNPAAVLFVDSENTFSTSHVLFANISANLNQPMLSIVSPIRSSEKAGVARFGIRWFPVSGVETKLCGHGTLAAAEAVFQQPNLLPSTGEPITVIEFETQIGVVVTASKVPFGNGEGLEIVFPAGMTRALDEAESNKVAPVIKSALPAGVQPVFVGTGIGAFDHILFIELDVKENLAQLDLNITALKTSGYVTHVLTTDSPSGEEAFVSRMFAPNVLGDTGEDHVCGSAHCLLTPYWVDKKSLAVGPELVIKATQVSKRGGNLGVMWNKDGGTVSLKGHLKVFSKGEFFV